MSREEERLHRFTLALAQRLYLAAEVLSIRAEKKKPKVVPSAMEIRRRTLGL